MCNVHMMIHLVSFEFGSFLQTFPPFNLIMYLHILFYYGIILVFKLLNKCFCPVLHHNTNTYESIEISCNFQILFVLVMDQLSI